MPIKSHTELTDLGCQIMTAAGADAMVAQRVVDHLVWFEPDWS